MTFSKYIIHHLDLSADLEPIVDAGNPAHYCVFWYRSIPLGETYLYSNGPVPPSKFWDVCIEAISPALADHLASRGQNAAREKACVAAALSFPQRDLAGIRDTCARILDHLQPREKYCANISVIVCTRNRAEYLRGCLHHLQNQYCQPAEIIVVDNASLTEETRVVAQNYRVRYIREDTPGLDVARNTGARAARFPIVAYTDDDTLPDRYWTYRVSQTFDNPAIVAMTGLVITASLQTEAEVIFERFWPFNRGYITRTFDEHFFHTTIHNGAPVWEIGAGANMAFRKDLFREIGYFDERLDVGAAGCSGDSELWYRILACGLNISYNPLAVVYHQHRTSIPGLRKQLFSYMRGFTVAILIQYQRFGHRGNLRHLVSVVPRYYLRLIRKGFPHYDFQYKTLFSELLGIFSGVLYYLRHRNTDSKIYSNDAY